MLKNILALLSTLCTVTSAFLMVVGIRKIRAGNIKMHRRLMLIAVLLAVVFLVLYLYRSLSIGNNTFGGPLFLKKYYLIFLFIHIILTILTPIVGIFTLVYAFQKNYVKHRKVGLVTYRLWLITAFTGLVVYLVLFVVFKEGQTVNILKVR